MGTITNTTFLLLLFILAGWIYRSWRSLSELKQAPTLRLTDPASRRGRVSVLIPAKNEEKNIADCVTPLLSQLREGDELLVINNCSEDNTEAVLKKLGAEKINGNIPQGTSGSGKAKASSPRFRYLNTPKTPDGWTGKNYALHLGAPYATGDWLLFTDADTRHKPESLNVVLSFAENKHLDLLTLLPRCLAYGFWENLIQPCAMSYMGLWFPIRKINDPRSNVYFGNGQYLLLSASHYQKIGGHDSVKEAFLEDFALMKKTKKLGARGVCAFGMEIYGTRMYDSFDALWRGWRRIYLHAFEQKPVPILKCALSVSLFSVFPFAVIPALWNSPSVSLFLCSIILVIIFATAFTAYGIVKAKRPYAVLHPFAALVFTAILFDAFQMAFFKRRTQWR